MFSSSDQVPITRTITLESTETLSPAEFEDVYEVARTADEIVRGDHRRIALQFPDDLLHDAVPLYRLLKEKVGPGREMYVLADTSYGSCCVDEVAAQHVNADIVIHYGHACMSQTHRLPVVYVFGKKPLDVKHCASAFAVVVSDAMTAITTLEDGDAHVRAPLVLLQHDVSYAYCADDLVRELGKQISVSIAYDAIPTRRDPGTSQNATRQADHHREHPALEQNTMILYVGGESLGLTNLLMIHGLAQVYGYNPETKTTRLESTRTNRLLMRRYAVVQKARDVDTWGILVGTLGVASYLPLISHLRKLISHAKKKSYTISVGKLNPAKLANFTEVEGFVLVACPENSVIDGKEFLRPIVTPFELEVALRVEHTWEGKYVLDFESFLGEKTIWEDRQTEDVYDDAPEFSLVTGKYRQAKRFGAEEITSVAETTSSALVTQNQEMGVSKLAGSAAATFFAERTFRGLEMRMGQDEPSELEQGRSGVPRGYLDDH